MLAHFHFINKGVLPFHIPHDERGRHELSKAASLNEEQLDFVWRTGDMIRDPERGEFCPRVEIWKGWNRLTD